MRRLEEKTFTLFMLLTLPCTFFRSSFPPDPCKSLPFREAFHHRSTKLSALPILFSHPPIHAHTLTHSHTLTPSLTCTLCRNTLNSSFASSLNQKTSLSRDKFFLRVPRCIIGIGRSFRVQNFLTRPPKRISTFTSDETSSTTRHHRRSG
jgi:hypothetical protein